MSARLPQMPKQVDAAEPAGAGAERFVDVALPLPLDRSFSYRLPPELPLPAPGCRVRVPFGAGEEVGFVLGPLAPAQLEAGLRAAPAKIKPVTEVLDPEPWLDAGLLRLARQLADYYAASLGEVLRSMLPVKPMKRPRAPAPAPLPPADAPQRLTPAQAAALAALTAALDAGGFARFLLDGVPGSGKTEVYLQAIAHCLPAGKPATVLVPEISLTPQAAQRFRARLGEGVGVFHSGLSAGERYLVWEGLRAGRLAVVLGARSAVFAPCPRLGLIVIDEEHDSSYKQTEKPRYHARSVAMLRAQAAGAVVLLGSATPALESLDNARRGKYRLLSLPERVTGQRRPIIEVLPMAAETGLLAAPLAEGIGECAARGEKPILLLARRGHSRLRLCRDCGETRRCSRCEIPLVYHSRRERLICHYCGQERQPEPACPACGSRRWVLLGAGTQQLELELGLRFPELPLHRMDLDSTRRRGAHAEILARFAAPGPALLLGTQMIAKGHHFPEVTLVGVVDADLGLIVIDEEHDSSYKQTEKPRLPAGQCARGGAGHASGAAARGGLPRALARSRGGRRCDGGPDRDPRSRGGLSGPPQGALPPAAPRQGPPRREPEAQPRASLRGHCPAARPQRGPRPGDRRRSGEPPLAPAALTFPVVAASFALVRPSTPTHSKTTSSVRSPTGGG